MLFPSPTHSDSEGSLTIIGKQHHKNEVEDDVGYGGENNAKVLHRSVRLCESTVVTNSEITIISTSRHRFLKSTAVTSYSSQESIVIEILVRSTRHLSTVLPCGEQVGRP